MSHVFVLVVFCWNLQSSSFLAGKQQALPQQGSIKGTMAQWTVASVCSEMKDCAALLVARKCSNDPKLQGKLLGSLEFKLKSLQHVTAANALELHTTLGECDFQEPLAGKLGAMIDEVLGNQEDEACTNTSLKPQTIWNIHVFLTAAEWQIMDGDQSWFAKQHMLVQRLKKLGVRSMTEKTVRACVALLCSTLATVPDDAATLYQLSLDFKQCFHTSENAAANVPYIVNFPEQPNGLPEQLLGHAYTQEDPPVHRSIPKLGQLRAAMILRNSHKSLRGVKTGKEVAKQLQPAMAAAPGSCSGASSMNVGSNMAAPADFNPMLHMMGTMFNVMANFAGCNGSQGSPNKVQGFCKTFAQEAMQFQPKTTTKTSLPLQLTDLEKPAVAVEAMPEDASEAKQAQDLQLPIGPSDEMEAEPADDPAQSKPAEPAVDPEPTLEQKLLDSLKQKQKGKQAEAKAAKPKSKPAAAKSKPKSKAAGAKGSGKGKVLKRPAAFNSGLPKYEPPAPTATQLDSQKVCFVDMHYHKARKIAFQADLSAEEASQYVRAARAAAGQMWDLSQ